MADKNYILEGNPIYKDDDIRKLRNTDEANAEVTFNPLFLRILNNIRALFKITSNKADKVEGKGLSTNDYTTADRDKLARVADNANNYAHPVTHPYSMLTGAPTSMPANGGTASNVPWTGVTGKPTTFPATTHTHDDRYYTEAEINAQMADKASTAVATTTANGLMSKEDKTKLNGIATGANNYVHPGTHPYSMITGAPTSLPANGGTADRVPWSGVTGKPTEFSPTQHRHNVSQISGLDSVATTGYVTKGRKFNSFLGPNATAEGAFTTASGSQSHAEGSGTTAQGLSAHAEGRETTAKGNYSHSGGFLTIAGEYQYAIGKNNIETSGPPHELSNTGSLLVIGNGTSTTYKGTAFRVQADGKVFGGVYSSGGADYAEMFEWLDDNPNNEDRRGLFVALDGEKIKIAGEDDFILGVVSANPLVVGNQYADQWKGMHELDIFNEPIKEYFEVEVEKNGEKISETTWKYKLNPNYNPNEPYISREDRKEWGKVGMFGQLIVIDDGTCVANGYCKPTSNGTATSAEHGYRVLARCDDSHINVLIK